MAINVAVTQPMGIHLATPKTSQLNNMQLNISTTTSSDILTHPKIKRIFHSKKTQLANSNQSLTNEYLSLCIDSNPLHLATHYVDKEIYINSQMANETNHISHTEFRSNLFNTTSPTKFKDLPIDTIIDSLPPRLVKPQP